MVSRKEDEWGEGSMAKGEGEVDRTWGRGPVHTGSHSSFLAPMDTARTSHVAPLGEGLRLAGFVHSQSLSSRVGAHGPRIQMGWGDTGGRESFPVHQALPTDLSSAPLPLPTPGCQFRA